MTYWAFAKRLASRPRRAYLGIRRVKRRLVYMGTDMPAYTLTTARHAQLNSGIRPPFTYARLGWGRQADEAPGRVGSLRPIGGWHVALALAFHGPMAGCSECRDAGGSAVHRPGRGLAAAAARRCTARLGEDGECSDSVRCRTGRRPHGRPRGRNAVDARGARA